MSRTVKRIWEAAREEFADDIETVIAYLPDRPQGLFRKPSLCFSSARTIFKHALPNALAPVFVSIAFGIASAILIESGLSFLGIGVPDDIVTWGSLLNLGRQNLEAWWLIIYPGMAIFLTITIYNMIAEASRDALDPRLKS